MFLIRNPYNVIGIQPTLQIPIHELVLWMPEYYIYFVTLKDKCVYSDWPILFQNAFYHTLSFNWTLQIWNKKIWLAVEIYIGIPIVPGTHNCTKATNNNWLTFSYEIPTDTTRTTNTQATNIDRGLWWLIFIHLMGKVICTIESTIAQNLTIIVDYFFSCLYLWAYIIIYQQQIRRSPGSIAHYIS